MKKIPEELALKKGGWIPCKGHTLPAYRRKVGGKLQDVVLVPEMSQWHLFTEGEEKRILPFLALMAALQAADKAKKASGPKKPRKG